MVVPVATVVSFCWAHAGIRGLQLPDPSQVEPTELGFVDWRCCKRDRDICPSQRTRRIHELAWSIQGSPQDSSRLIRAPGLSRSIWSLIDKPWSRRTAWGGCLLLCLPCQALVQSFFKFVAKSWRSFTRRPRFALMRKCWRCERALRAFVLWHDGAGPGAFPSLVVTFCQP